MALASHVKPFFAFVLIQQPFKNVVQLDITKKQPKSDHRVSKFEWRNLSLIFFGYNAFS